MTGNDEFNPFLEEDDLPWKRWHPASKEDHPAEMARELETTADLLAEARAIVTDLADTAAFIAEREDAAIAREDDKERDAQGLRLRSLELAIDSHSSMLESDSESVLVTAAEYYAFVMGGELPGPLYTDREVEAAIEVVQAAAEVEKDEAISAAVDLERARAG